MQKTTTNGINVDNNSINDSNNTQIESEIESETEIETERKVNTLNYTRLNLLFNYLRCENEKFENLNEIDKIVIVNKLKKLEIYIKEIPYSLSEEAIEDLKIQYWTIMEIYLSPYKIYLNKLTRENFIFRFLKVKKYINYKLGSEDDLKHFVSYFIKSLMEELKGNGGKS